MIYAYSLLLAPDGSPHWPLARAAIEDQGLGMIKVLFNALVAAISFRVSPISLGVHGIRGFLMQMGLDPNRIPNSALRELAQDAYKTTLFESRLRKRPHLVCFTERLEGQAAQIVAGFQPRRAWDPAQDVHVKFQALDVLRRHGMRLPIDGMS